MNVYEQVLIIVLFFIGTSNLAVGLFTKAPAFITSGIIFMSLSVGLYFGMKSLKH